VESKNQNCKKSSRGVLTKIVIAVLVIVVLFLAFKYFGVQDKLTQALEWIRGLGAIAPIVFAGVYIFACVFLISGAALTFGAGAIFGLAWGTLYASVASMLGATAAFLVGRYLARDWVAKKIEGNQTFKAIDEAVADEGWKIVGLTRLSPVFPFVLLNYAFGLTKVNFRGYFFASWVAMLPGTFMYVYLGYLGREATGAGGESTSALRWTLNLVGLAATVVVTVMVTKIARKALSKRIDEPEAKVAVQHGETT